LVKPFGHTKGLLDREWLYGEVRKLGLRVELKGINSRLNILIRTRTAE
jgi:hypothetical protein